MIKNWKLCVSGLVLIGVILVSYLLLTENPKRVMSGNIEVRDGLIYRALTDKLFTGTFIDTLEGKIVEYDVRNGIKNGRFGIYQKDGTPQITGFIKNNKNNGEWKYYFPNGSLECIGIFKNDKITDKWTWFHPNGKIKEEGFFINGVREGSWVRYDPDGNVNSRISFKNDMIVNELKAERFFSI